MISLQATIIVFACSAVSMLWRTPFIPDLYDLPLSPCSFLIPLIVPLPKSSLAGRGQTPDLIPKDKDRT